MVNNVKRLKSNQNKRVTSGAGLKKTFHNIVKHTKKHIQKLKPQCKKMLLDLAYTTARELVSELPIKLPRVIAVPKTGGFLPIIPIFAGLSAIGSLPNGVNGIKDAVDIYNSAKKQLSELKKRNMQMEGISIGNGLHLKPYKSGLGIYVTKKKN